MTGCRRNEIATLHRFDVDLDAGELHLARDSVHEAAARIADRIGADLLSRGEGTGAEGHDRAARQTGGP